MDYLTVDDNIPFKTHAEILGKVFQKKTRNGTPPKLALRGGCAIKRNQWAAFFCLAEPWKHKGFLLGGWRPPRDNKWINIPDSNEKAFTQIQLNKQGPAEFTFPRTNIAVFMYKKGIDGAYAYYFYGIFERRDAPKDIGVSVYRRTSAVLRYSEWRADNP